MIITQPLNAVIVCVDFADILDMTLGYNRDHFQKVVVVTSIHDEQTPKVCRKLDAQCLVTDVFYRQGAAFNKWAGLEQGLDYIGREGWMLVMDADIMIPRQPPVFTPSFGCLYTPLRRDLREGWQTPPHEPYWKRLKFVNRREEHAGYFQLFHADTPCLAEKPWYPTDFSWAGTSDTFFQQRFKDRDKLRPPFEVLHLGEPFTNWAGRVQPYRNGVVPEEAEKRRGIFRSFMQQRRVNAGIDDRYRGERLCNGPQ